MTGHLPGGETRFVANGSHGHEGRPAILEDPSPR
jgi:hypothetical protein